MVGGVSKRPLPVVDRDHEGLGAPTIMEPALAARHGAPYVHLAVFAIDVDRVRAFVEAEHPEHDLPFGWEVFLTELYLLRSFDAEHPRALAVIEDACLSVLELGTDPEGEPPLGSQLPFAVHDAVQRGVLPGHLASLFASWRGRAGGLVQELEPLWREAHRHGPALASLCLEVPMEPPLPGPTVHALEELARA
jgi:hypothetical protein